MGSEGGVNRSIIHELHSWYIRGNQMEGGSVLLEVSLMNLILRISREIKRQVEVVLLEV